MSALPFVITTVGKAALVAAGNTGSAAVHIAQIGFTATAFVPAAATAALPAEVKRLATVGGLVVSADTIHVTVSDTSADVYDVRGFALYLEDGTLFGSYGQAGLIVQKGAGADLLLAADLRFTTPDAGLIAFGATDWINPPASETVQGVMQLATQAEVTAGMDDQKAVTPKKFRAAFTWANLQNKPNTFAPSAHTHPIGEVNALQTALDGKAPLAGVGGDWSIGGVLSLGGGGSISFGSNLFTFSQQPVRMGGGSSLSPPSEVLTVDNPFGRGIACSNTTGTSTDAFLINVASTATYLQSYTLNGALVGTITTDGYNVFLHSTSDPRLKTEVQPMVDPAGFAWAREADGPLGRIARIPAVTFLWKEGEERGRVPGFLSTDVEQEIPYAVIGAAGAMQAIGDRIAWDGEVIATNVPDPLQLGEGAVAELLAAIGRFEIEGVPSSRELAVEEIDWTAIAAGLPEDAVVTETTSNGVSHRRTWSAKGSTTVMNGEASETVAVEVLFAWTKTAELYRITEASGATHNTGRTCAWRATGGRIAPQRLDASKMIADLHGALQQMMALRGEDLARIATLEARLA